MLALVMMRVQLEPSSFQRPRRLARPRTPPFHGDNTGSNPVGDANNLNNLAKIPKFPAGPKRSNKDFLVLDFFLLGKNEPCYLALRIALDSVTACA